MISLFMLIGYLVILMTGLLVGYVVLMYLCGIDIITLFKPLFTFEKVVINKPKQNVVDVSLVRADVDIVNSISQLASEWDIDLTSSRDDVWVSHSTDSYDVFVKRG